MNKEKLKRDKNVIWTLKITLFIFWFLSQEQCVQFSRFLLGRKSEDTIFGFPLTLQIFSSVLFYIMSVFYTDEYNQIAESIEKHLWKRKAMDTLFYLGNQFYRILVFLVMLFFKIIFSVGANQKDVKTVDDTHKLMIQKYEQYPKKMRILYIALALSGSLYFIAYILELTYPEIIPYYSKVISLAVSFIGFLSIARSSTTYFLSQNNATQENED